VASHRQLLQRRLRVHDRVEHRALGGEEAEARRRRLRMQRERHPGEPRERPLRAREIAPPAHRDGERRERIARDLVFAARVAHEIDAGVELVDGLRRERARGRQPIEDLPPQRRVDGRAIDPPLADQARPQRLADQARAQHRVVERLAIEHARARQELAQHRGRRLRRDLGRRARPHEQPEPLAYRPAQDERAGQRPPREVDDQVRERRVGEGPFDVGGPRGVGGRGARERHGVASPTALAQLDDGDQSDKRSDQAAWTARPSDASRLRGSCATRSQAMGSRARKQAQQVGAYFSSAPSSICAPSRVGLPSTNRMLKTAFLLQNEQVTFTSSMLSASSRSRCEPGKSRVRKSVRRP
jgi:hypothetical protein